MRYVLGILIMLASPLALAGKIGSGGGNLYHGKLLESYIVDPSTLPGFGRLASQIALLNASYDTRELLAAVLKKNWYLVPGPLSSLPAESIGSAVPTDQAALQDFSSVWIDQDIFEGKDNLGGLPEDQQAELILHEIFMGFRLYKYESLSDQCRILYTEGTYCDKRDHTSKTPSDLTKQDYEVIRRMVRTFIDHPPKDEFNLFRLLTREGFSFPYAKFETKLRAPHPEDFYQAFSTAKLSGHWPNAGYEQFDALHPDSSYGYTVSQKFTPTDHCKFQFSRNPKGTGFHLEIRTKNRKPYIFDVDEVRPEYATEGEYFFYFANGKVSGGRTYSDVPIGTKVTWLSIEIPDPGALESDGKYYTTAQLGNITIYKGVRVDMLGNDSIDWDQSIMCSNHSPYDPSIRD